MTHKGVTIIIIINIILTSHL